MGKAEWGGNPVCWWLGLYFSFVVWMNHPAQGATGGWVMLGLVFKWLPLCEFSLLDASWGEGWHPTPVLLPGKSRAAGHGVAKGRTRLSDSLSLFTFMHWRRKCNPLQCSCLENLRDGGAWWAAVHGVAQSWTQEWLSEKAIAPHSSTLAWKIPSMEEPGGLQSMGSQRVEHNWVTSPSLSLSCTGEGNATHSSVLAWRIPGTGEPGGLPSMGSHKVGHWSVLATAAAAVWSFKFLYQL